MIAFTPVKSSSLKEVAHDPEKNELHVRFKDGALYVYPSTTADEHRALLAAESIGRHFHAKIRTKGGRKVTAGERKTDDTV